MEIRDIGVGDIQIRSLDIPPVVTRGYNVFDAQVPVPVVVNIGLPIVNMPGCVEAHEQNTTSERSGVLSDDDPKGVKTYCDAGTPSFNPIQYEPEQMVITRPPPPVDTRVKDEKPETETKELTAPPGSQPLVNTADIECPTQKQLSEEPVGFIFDNGRKEVTGYRLEGTQCIREVREVPIVEQAINGLPPTGTVITTGAIAVVATTSALLAKPFADILLKVVKPTVKKVLKKVASIRGKQLKVQSVTERRAEQRDRNQAIAKLKSVVAKTKKKG